MARKPRQSCDTRYVTRRAFDGLRRTLDEHLILIENLQRDSQIQFRRIAQIQIELDDVRRAWAKAERPKRRNPT